MARILIVDDEVLMREMAGESLRRQGHDVVLGRNGQEGLDLLNRVRDDVGENGKVESMPRLEGRQMVMMIAPR